MRFSTIVVVVLFACSATIVHAAGDLDPLFGSGGKVILDLGAQESGTAMVLQPDGKMILGGSTGVPQDFAMVRLNPNGSLDPTFGSGGVVTINFLGDADAISGLALQTDGKIIAAGRATPDNTSLFVIAIARFNPNGTLDPTFGSGGKATATLPDTNFSVAGKVVLDSTGKIIVAGGSGNTVTAQASCFVARFNPNGTLDPTFGGGIVAKHFGTTAGSEIFRGVAVQTDDKIVASGAVGASGSHGAGDVVTVRYNPNGSLDATFGNGGVVFTDFSGGTDYSSAVRIQPDGKIVSAGSTIGSSTAAFDFAVVRYNPNGSLDPTFGDHGEVTTDFSNADDLLSGMVLQTNGKIIVLGLTDAARSPRGSTIGDFALVRYNPNGSLDPTFGSSGFVVTTMGPEGDSATEGVVQPDGKIVAAGIVENNGIGDFAVARYNGDILLPPQCGLYGDDFEDGVLAADWTYVKPDWAETGGNLVGTPAHGKAEAIADPAFAGCGPAACTVQTTMQTAGGQGSKIFFFAFHQDKQNTVEVIMDEKKDSWVFKQIAGGHVVAKTKGLAVIDPNILYDVRIAFDGTTFQLIVDGVTLATVPAGSPPSGTMGYRVKKTIGKFGNLCAN